MNKREQNNVEQIHYFKFQEWGIKKAYVPIDLNNITKLSIIVWYLPKPAKQHIIFIYVCNVYNILYNMQV